MIIVYEHVDLALSAEVYVILFVSWKSESL